MRILNPAILVTIAVGAWGSGVARAHCDSLDGPVVRDAQAALDRADATPVRKWVAPEQEPELLEVFSRALTVRGLGGDARALADRLFFETVVRLHRASEGEAFTGLKPAGSAEPGLVAADEALARGSVADLATELAAAVEEGIEVRFATVREAERHEPESVAAGRAYVAAYVEYAHFVERIDELVRHGAPDTHHDPLPTAGND